MTRAFISVFFSFLLVANLASAEPQNKVVLPERHFVPDFSIPQESLAFVNYKLWKKSRFPDCLQLKHCTGLALLVRQVHNWGKFDANAPRLTGGEAYALILRSIYLRPTASSAANDAQRTLIPGFHDLHQLSLQPELQDAVKDVLKDSVFDVFRTGFGWAPWDLLRVLTKKQRTKIELQIRKSIAQDQMPLVYLTSGFRQAHAILMYGYEDRGDQVVYYAYDSRKAGKPVQIPFFKGIAKFKHPDPDLDMRAPWILHRSSACDSSLR